MVLAARISTASAVPGGGVSGCNYYASPTGGGDGLSLSRPFTVSSFWKLAKPGDTLCLLSGTYTSSHGMITPPPGLAGTPNAPITLRALADGEVLITGSGIRKSVWLYRNDWFVIQGINACCSSANVIQVMRSSHNVIRRVAAWDAAEGNYSIFGIHHGHHNLLEDVAGWGIARKTFESSQGGNFTTIRRAWGRWEGSHVAGPKMVYTLAYNNYGMLVENAVGTWSGEKMRETYVLMDYYGKPLPRTYADYGVNQPYGIFAIDALKDDEKARARLLGSIAYITARDTFKAPYLVLVTRLASVEIADTLAYVEPDSYPRVRTFGLYGPPISLKGLFDGLTSFTDRSETASLLARNITSLGGAGDLIANDWETRNVLTGASPAIYGPRESAFNTTRGANLCHRYVDGVLTNQPLWPWPMNKRIIEATASSGRKPVNVTATIEEIFGPIPSQCSASP
jgi:hypothetical protein